MAYSLKNIRVRRVLECLRDTSRKSLQEVTNEYNRRYPPSRIRMVIGIKVEKSDILRILKFLVEQKLVEKELYTFTDQPLDVPEFLFWLSQEGIHQMSGKR